MSDFNLKVKSVLVLLCPGPDKISLTLDLPSGCWPYDGLAYATLEVAHGTGVLYCKTHFGLTPEVIDARPKPYTFSKKRYLK